MKSIIFYTTSITSPLIVAFVEKNKNKNPSLSRNQFHYFQQGKSNSLLLAGKRWKDTQQSQPLLSTPSSSSDNQVGEFEDDELTDGLDEYFDHESDEAADDADLYAGDGAGGGGKKFAATSWDEQVFAIAEDVCKSNGDLAIYAFKTLANLTIQVRIEKLSNKSGSPGMTDIEAFSAAYRALLDEAELAGLIPKDISLEVSSPGVERVVRVPQDLERFKDRPMYVKYVDEIESTESDGIFKLVSYDMETKCCIWGIADVRLNREKAGKGRPLNKKQRTWRLNTPFDSLHLVRIYSDI